jgi:hypothetical protein
MTGKRPLDTVSYAAIANARKGARSKTVDIACPICGPQRQGHLAKRKVLRTWTLGDDRITLHCVRCGVEGWVAPDGKPAQSESLTISAAPLDDDEERERQRKLEAAARIWRQSCSIAGTAGEAYFNRRKIDLAVVPDYGGLRFHPRCPWNGNGTMPCVVARYTDTITGAPCGIWRRPISGEMARTLGTTKRCVIRLWPDDAVTTGLVIGEGIETVLAAATRITHRGTLLQPAWACGYAINLERFPVLPGTETLTLLVDNDANGAGQEAAAACARRWIDAGREVIRLTPKTVGADFNDIVILRESAA